MNDNDNGHGDENIQPPQDPFEAQQAEQLQQQVQQADRAADMLRGVTISAAISILCDAIWPEVTRKLWLE